MDEKSASRLYGLLLGLSALFAIAAISTILPSRGASWNNILGYKSLCTFTPISTAICALLAAITCVIRSRLVGPKRGVKRSWVLPLAVGIVLALVIGLSIPPYAAATADARSGASISKTE
jgi:hypothetical protein